MERLTALPPPHHHSLYTQPTAYSIPLFSQPAKNTGAGVFLFLSWSANSSYYNPSSKRSSKQTWPSTVQLESVSCTFRVWSGSLLLTTFRHISPGFLTAPGGPHSVEFRDNLSACQDIQVYGKPINLPALLSRRSQLPQSTLLAE